MCLTLASLVPYILLFVLHFDSILTRVLFGLVFGVFVVYAFVLMKMRKTAFVYSNSSVIKNGYSGNNA